MRRAAPIAYVLKGYPRLSETFIANEIRALENRGLDLRLFALRRPTDRAIHPVHREIAAPVVYLPEYLHHEPRRVIAAWIAGRRRPGYGAAKRAFLADLKREPTRNRFRRFGQALALAAALPRDVGSLHAHFLHTPASVTRYAALLTGLPWTASAHAKDVWTTPEWDLRDKLRCVRWLATCTAAGADRLRTLAPEPGRVALIYHGLEASRFPPFAGDRPPRDGSDPHDPVLLLSVGRTVEKKGFDVLLDALQRLPAELSWRWIHIGDGALTASLQQTATRNGIAACIEWRGAQPQEVVLQAYRAADLFVLPCKVAHDGDRDGLPNVLMEAQSQRLPCLSTRISGVPELIEDGVSGRLVAPGDAIELSRALACLIGDPRARAAFGDAGFMRLRRLFSFDAAITALEQRFAAPEVALATSSLLRPDEAA